MVSAGQYLERPTLIPVAGGLVLEGVAHRGARVPGLLILPPPPFVGAEVAAAVAPFGGGMDHVVAAELAFAVSRAGHSTLRFNYRGVGASQGPLSRDVGAWLEDATEAYHLAVDNAGGAPAALAAIGASDAVALELARRHPVAAVALVCPRVVRPADLVALGPRRWPMGVVLAELEAGEPPGAWSEALAGEGVEVTVVPGATSAFERNLPWAGKVVAALVERASSPTPRRD